MICKILSELLKRRIEEQNQVIRKQNQEIKIQRKRNEELRKKLEVVEDYKLARIDENRARKSVNLYSFVLTSNFEQ